MSYQYYDDGDTEIAGAPQQNANGYFDQQQNPGYQPNPGYQQNPGYQPNPGYQGSGAPVGQLKTNKALWKYLVFSMLTFGIYGLVVMSSVSSDINVIASRYDGKRTMHFCLLTFLISWLTLGIGTFVWYHKISARIGRELNRRGIKYSFGTGTFWGWGVLGVLLFVFVGPCIYYHKLFKAMNLLASHYNVYG